MVNGNSSNSFNYFLIWSVTPYTVVITVCLTTFLLQRPINSLKNYLKELFRSDQINDCKQNLKLHYFNNFWYHTYVCPSGPSSLCWLSFHSHGITLLLSEHFTRSKVVALGSVLDAAARLLDHHPDTPRHAARELGAQFGRHLLVPHSLHLSNEDVTPLGVHFTEFSLHYPEYIFYRVEVR